MAGKGQKTGTRDTHHHLSSALDQLLKGAATCEQYLRDAQKAGDAELVQFFKDWQDEQRNLSERAKNLLGARGADVGSKPEAAKSPTNAGVKSGGNAQDDIVDEQSKESFPASDAPATY
jgi:hypothetical protein